jgi:hypothetical protein
MASSEDVHDLVQQMMAAYAQDAIEAARANYQIDLDFSDESVKQVEEVLARVYSAVRRGWFRNLFRTGLNADQLDTICKMFGGYIGEVIRRKHGGFWSVIDSPTGEGKVICLERGDDKIFPPARVYKRLTNGAEDDVWFYFQVVTSDAFESPPSDSA